MAKTILTYHKTLKNALDGTEPVEHGRFRRVEKNGKFLVEEQLELGCPECERSNGPHYTGTCEHGL